MLRYLLYAFIIDHALATCNIELGETLGKGAYGEVLEIRKFDQCKDKKELELSCCNSGRV